MKTATRYAEDLRDQEYSSGRFERSPILKATKANIPPQEAGHSQNWNWRLEDGLATATSSAGRAVSTTRATRATRAALRERPDGLVSSAGWARGSEERKSGLKPALHNRRPEGISSSCSLGTQDDSKISGVGGSAIFLNESTIDMPEIDKAVNTTFEQVAVVPSCFRLLCSRGTTVAKVLKVDRDSTFQRSQEDEHSYNVEAADSFEAAGVGRKERLKNHPRSTGHWMESLGLQNLQALFTKPPQGGKSFQRATTTVAEEEDDASGLLRRRLSQGTAQHKRSTKRQELKRGVFQAPKVVKALFKPAAANLQQSSLIVSVQGKDVQVQKKTPPMESASVLVGNAESSATKSEAMKRIFKVSQFKRPIAPDIFLDNYQSRMRLKVRQELVACARSAITQSRCGSSSKPDDLFPLRGFSLIKPTSSKRVRQTRLPTRLWAAEAPTRKARSLGGSATRRNPHLLEPPSK